MRSISLTAPSRLHFGLWSLGGAASRQFGGVGVMIKRPTLRLVIEEADEFCVEGLQEDRGCEFAQRWATFHRRALPPCRIRLVETTPGHAGLGSGTQLALGVAALLGAWVGLSEQSPQELAQSVDRGRRSAVGTYGFAYGGLIVERGKASDEPVSPLDLRIDMPEPWRFVLIRPRGVSGLAGEDESLAFEALAPVPQATTDRLIDEVKNRLVPAAVTGNFQSFADTLYAYGRSSGQCFAARQGGPYNGPIVTTLVETIRSRGYPGVGQSSWGPTVFVATESAAAAEQLATWITSEPAFSVDVSVAEPSNQGALLEDIDAAN